MNNKDLEIERKFMIVMPDSSFLETLEHTDIVQTYLSSEKGISERVRKRGREGVWEYTHNIKQRINDMRRREIERSISREEYEGFLLRADPGRNVIHKRRYLYEYAGAVWEIDVFPFWKDKALIEIELEDEKQQIVLPPAISFIRELTADGRYTNAALAKKIPED